MVGVSAYQHVGPLPAEVVNDARDIAGVLTDTSLCGYLPENVQVLTDGDATKERIVEGLRWLASTSGEDDTAVFFFSGHGGRIVGAGGGTYLCPVGFKSDDATATGIEALEVTDLLRLIRSSRLAVLLDACHAAGAGSLKSLAPPTLKAAIGRGTLEQLGAGTGRVILASSTEEEYSRILPGMRNSLFTHHLLQGLRGAALHRGDGLIRVLDLFTYVAEETGADGTQHPVLKADALQDNFPLALFMGGSKGVVSTTEIEAARPAPFNRSHMDAVFARLYPTGPSDSEIWSRAGGDIATLKLGLSGKAAWHAALKLLDQGGGGREISFESLVAAALDDYANNAELASLVR